MRLSLIFVESCLLVAACIFASLSILVAYAQVFQDPLNLSNGIPDSHEPQIAVSGNNVYIILTGFGSGVEDQDDIFFKKSSNGGANFSDTINLSNNIGSSFNPKIAVSGKNVYVIWQDDTGNTGGNTSIFFQKSSDSGTTFSQTINLSNDTGFATDPQLSLFGSTIHVIWRDDTPGPDETFSKRSINSGNSFSESLNISKSVDTDSINGKVYAIANKVYIVWTEGDIDEGRTSILASASSDNGATFSQAINMSNNSEFADNARVSAFGNNEYILWMQGKFNEGEILFKKSSDGGATFGQTIRLSDSNNTSSNPLLLTSDGNVYTVWTSNETNKANVYSRTSLDDGTTFENVKNLSQGTFGRSNLAIAGNKSTIYVVWEEENPEGSNIAIRKSSDAGASFSNSMNLSKYSDYSSYPAISVYDNKLYVAWQDNVNGMDQIRFTREN